MPTDFKGLVNVFLDLFNLVIPIFVTLTLVVIIWKVVDTWVINAGDPSKVAEGRNVVAVGVVALVFMTAIWGIVAIVQTSLGFSTP